MAARSIGQRGLFPGQSGTAFRTPRRFAHKNAAESPTGLGVRARPRRFFLASHRLDRGFTEVRPSFDQVKASQTWSNLVKPGQSQSNQNEKIFFMSMLLHS
jgi:hypothetical protein